jgi:hypothetical protein
MGYGTVIKIRKITVNADWHGTAYGYIVGLITVTDSTGNLLMRDEDMYYNADKFFQAVKRKFCISRFQWDSKIYHKAQNRLEIIGQDMKGE